MITRENYIESTKKIDFTKLPANLQEGNAFFISRNKFYGKSALITEMIDSYLKSLNKYQEEHVTPKVYPANPPSLEAIVKAKSTDKFQYIPAIEIDEERNLKYITFWGNSGSYVDTKFGRLIIWDGNHVGTVKGNTINWNKVDKYPAELKVQAREFALLEKAAPKKVRVPKGPRYDLITENIKNFFPKDQLAIIRQNLRGEEASHFEEKLIEFDKRISEMSATYDQENTPTPDKIVWLHYFGGNNDWYITEKDKGSPDDTRPGMQQQAFGYADMGEGEWGYISIEEIINLHSFPVINIDLYWTPKKWSETEPGKPTETPAPPIPDEDPLPVKKFNPGDIVSLIDTTNYDSDLVSHNKSVVLNYNRFDQENKKWIINMSPTDGPMANAIITNVDEGNLKLWEEQKKEDIKPETKREPTAEELNQATELGRQAFAEGKKRKPLSDKKFNKLFKSIFKKADIGSSESHKLYVAWYTGWDEANLAAPVKPKTLSKNTLVSIIEGEHAGEVGTIKKVTESGYLINLSFGDDGAIPFDHVKVYTGPDSIFFFVKDKVRVQKVRGKYQLQLAAGGYWKKKETYILATEAIAAAHDIVNGIETPSENEAAPPSSQEAVEEVKPKKEKPPKKSRAERDHGVDKIAALKSLNDKQLDIRQKRNQKLIEKEAKRFEETKTATPEQEAWMKELQALDRAIIDEKIRRDVDEKVAAKKRADKKVEKRKAKAEKKEKHLAQKNERARQAFHKYLEDHVTKLAKSNRHMTQEQILEEGRRINNHRLWYVIAKDNASDNKKRLSPNKENLLRWMKHPGSFDLIGVDTFKLTDPTADLRRMKKQIIFNQLGHKVD